MDWSSAPAVLIAGILGLLMLSLAFWAGQALLNFLESDGPLREAERYVPDGQERLATSLEINDVVERMERSRSLSASGPGRL
jgi:hypothetical protein